MFLGHQVLEGLGAGCIAKLLEVIVLWENRVPLEMGKFPEIEPAECGWNRHPERWWDLHPGGSRLAEAQPRLNRSSVGNSPASSWRVDERPPELLSSQHLSCGSMEGWTWGGFSAVISESSAGSRWEAAPPALQLWEGSLGAAWEKASAVWGGGITLRTAITETS